MATWKFINPVGSTGRCYFFNEVDTGKTAPWSRLVSIIRATSHGVCLSNNLYSYMSINNNFILKAIPLNIFSAFNEKIRPRLPQTSRIRLPLDDIPDQRIFVYEYQDDEPC